MELVRVSPGEIDTLWEMQKEAFSGLLEKYRDHDTNPACETKERVEQKVTQENSFFYFIVEDGIKSGAVRVIDKKDGSRKRISPIFIMKQFRGRGFAQKAMKLAEDIHGSDNWMLETILQEPSNCHLYEKLGYKRTGKIVNVKDGMDLVYYEKDR